MEGGPFGERKFFEKKSHNVETKSKRVPLVSPGIVCYAGKYEKRFWFSSLGQLVQVDIIKLRRTSENFFFYNSCGLKNRNHYNCHEAPNKIQEFETSKESPL